MNILLTNDDGVFAPGIAELGRQLLEKGYNVTIVAPEKQNSGKSHAITLIRNTSWLCKSGTWNIWQ